MSTITAYPIGATTLRAPMQHYRLTRRGRLAVLLIAFVAVLAVGVVLSSGSAATETPEATRVMVVDAGDTLWEIASDHAESGDVRNMIVHLQDLNDLDGSRLYAGQRLRVPA